MLKQEKTKAAIVELQQLLNNEVVHGNLNSQEILNISVKLDVLIADFCSVNMKKKE